MMTALSTHPRYSSAHRQKVKRRARAQTDIKKKSSEILKYIIILYI